MKKIIEYFYRFKIDSLKNIDDSCFIKSGFNVFYFVPTKYSDDYLYELFEINKYIVRFGYHKIILNFDNRIVTIVDKKRYVLLKINNKSLDFIGLKEIKFIPVTQNFSLLIRSNWSKMWQERVDYTEYQILHDNSFKESIYYFLGISENAISYIENIFLSNNVGLFICHRRVYDKMKKIDYYNPLDVIIDYRVRDVAEYLKYAFLNNSYNIDEIDSYLNSINYSDIEYKLLYARLLFPTFYFDLYEKVLNKEVSSDIMHCLLNRCNEYEDYLQSIYSIISKKVVLEEVDWLKKRESN